MKNFKKKVLFFGRVWEKPKSEEKKKEENNLGKAKPAR